MVQYYRNYRIQKMMRNYSHDRYSHKTVHSPETKKYSSHLSIQQNPPLYCIEKSRAMSHKKLTITSSPVNDDRTKQKPQIRFNQPNTSQVTRFYKNPSKPSLLLQSKKSNNFEDAKVSLKTSNYGFAAKDVSSRENCSELQKFKKQVMENLKKYIGNAEKQKETQQIQIRILKQKIQKMEKQLISKQHLIRELNHKNCVLSPKSQQVNNGRKDKDNEIYAKKINDLQAILRNFTSISMEQQAKIDKKLQHINSRFLHYIVLKKDVSDKLHKTNAKLLKIEENIDKKFSNISTKYEDLEKNMTKFKNVQKMLNNLQSQVCKIEQHALCTKQTIGTIQNWESFQDYTQTNEISNTSTISYGGTDIFFYPIFGNKQQSKDSCCGNTTIASKQSSVFSESSTSKLESLVKKLIGEYEKHLPLACWMDKFNRLVPRNTNRPLRNQQEQYYYKLNEKQAQFLERGQYIKFISVPQSTNNSPNKQNSQFYSY